MNLKKTEVGRIGEDVKYLREQYEQFKLYGSRPDGDVKFDTLIQWLFDNQYDVMHMIQVANKIESIPK